MTEQKEHLDNWHPNYACGLDQCWCHDNNALNEYVMSRHKEEEQHECEWVFMADEGVYSPEGSYGAYCPHDGCGEELSATEVERRLNEYETLKKATEKLSAENARYYAKETRMLALRKYLNDYAEILEGEK